MEPDGEEVRGGVGLVVPVRIDRPGLLGGARLHQLLQLEPGAEQLGPVPTGPDTERLLLRVPRTAGPQLAARRKAAAAVRSARKADPVRIELDPSSVG